MFFLAVAAATAEPKNPLRQFFTEAGFTLKCFALKAFPFKLLLYFKIVITGICRIDSIYTRLLGPCQSFWEWVPDSWEGVRGI